MCIAVLSANIFKSIRTVSVLDPYGDAKRECPTSVRILFVAKFAAFAVYNVDFFVYTARLVTQEPSTKPFICTVLLMYAKYTACAFPH